MRLQLTIVNGLQPRAIAAGLVSPVSTRLLFSLTRVVACLSSLISTTAWRTPHTMPRYHVETCEMATNSATELFQQYSFQHLSALTSERLVSQALPVKAVPFSR